MHARRRSDTNPRPPFVAGASQTFPPRSPRRARRHSMAPKCGNSACLGGVSCARVCADALLLRLRRQYPNGRRFPRPPLTPLTTSHPPHVRAFPQETPLWRKGWVPAGTTEPTPLCNACGLLCAPCSLRVPAHAPRGSFRSLFQTTRSSVSGSSFSKRASRRLATTTFSCSRVLAFSRSHVLAFSQVQARLVLLVVRDRLPEARGRQRPSRARVRARR